MLSIPIGRFPRISSLGCASIKYCHNAISSGQSIIYILFRRKSCCAGWVSSYMAFWSYMHYILCINIRSKHTIWNGLIGICFREMCTKWNRNCDHILNASGESVDGFCISNMVEILRCVCECDIEVVTFKIAHIHHAEV